MNRGPASRRPIQRSTTASRSNRIPSSNVRRELKRQRSCTNIANSVPLTSCCVEIAEFDPLGQRPVDAPNLDRTAEAVARITRPLEVGAELEHVLPAPEIARQAQRLDPLQTVDVTLLVVEKAAALRLRRVDHRRRFVGVHLDLEAPDRQRRLDHERRDQIAKRSRARPTSRSG